MIEIPTWEQLMWPTMRVLSDGSTQRRLELCDNVADFVGLDDEQRAVLTASGYFLYENRTGWALSFLAKIGAIDRPRRGAYCLTEGGRWLLQTYPNGLREREVKELTLLEETPIRPYVATVRAKGKADESNSSETEAEESDLSPLEQVEAGIERIQEGVSDELLSRLRGSEPEFFERAVVELLLAMGYGGTNGRGQVTRLSRDGGIDGVIDQDALGLSRVYVQAKRYAELNSVQAPEVRGFAGAVYGQADSGVFITSSRFSAGAREFVKTTPARLVLIDGEQLATLMIKYKVGVQARKTFEAVEIDEDFFS